MAEAPPPSVSLRQSPKGGDVLDPPVANPSSVLKLQWQLVLLIHGYNNTLRAGRDAYEGFRAVQRELAELEPDQPITHGQIVDVYWPGDANWGIVSALYYMWSIDKAKRSAEVLAGTLEEAIRESGFKQIDIVAHSMGGRFTLELIKHLIVVPNLIVRRVVFMAAAVPVFMLEPNDAHQLRAAYDTKLQGGAISLFSPDDMVLSLAFPVGQTLAGAGEGWFPTALGHDLWVNHLTPGNLSQHQISGAGHSDYWGWNQDSIEQARMANTYVRNFLGFPGRGERDIPSREVIERPTGSERTRDYDREPPQ